MLIISVAKNLSSPSFIIEGSSSLKRWTLLIGIKLSGSGSEVFENEHTSIFLTIELETLASIELQKKGVEKQLVRLSETRYKELCTRLGSIPGIGLLGAMTLITEIKDIHRFSNLDKLHSFVGLVPNVSSSSERETISGITQRHNHYLRPVLVRCA